SATAHNEERHKWESDYLFTEFKGKHMCLVCLETKSAMKDFNLSCHYNMMHEDKYDILFTKTMTTQESSLRASYAVYLELAKAKKKLKQVMYDCKYFSLVLDESTDVMDVNQLLIFTRAIARSFEVHEELLKLVSLHDTTNGKGVLNAVKSCK
uniref:General transcription factor II-I repeat domain-containing protein 2 n=1 Tax=Dicentrarchus labrax TaxID=13489 RepID=A0A8C4FDD0_DICLA